MQHWQYEDSDCSVNCRFRYCFVSVRISNECLFKQRRQCVLFQSHLRSRYQYTGDDGVNDSSNQGATEL